MVERVWTARFASILSLVEASTAAVSVQSAWTIVGVFLSSITLLWGVRVATMEIKS
jgi:hypothetical protein